jgi:hypothetical protein
MENIEFGVLDKCAIIYKPKIASTFINHIAEQSNGCVTQIEIPFDVTKFKILKNNSSEEKLTLKNEFDDIINKNSKLDVLFLFRDPKIRIVTALIQDYLRHSLTDFTHIRVHDNEVRNPLVIGSLSNSEFKQSDVSLFYKNIDYIYRNKNQSDWSNYLKSNKEQTDIYKYIVSIVIDVVFHKLKQWKCNHNDSYLLTYSNLYSHFDKNKVFFINIDDMGVLNSKLNNYLENPSIIDNATHNEGEKYIKGIVNSIMFDNTEFLDLYHQIFKEDIAIFEYFNSIKEK